MKNIIIALILCTVSNIGFSQNQSIERFYKKYTNLDNVTEINISGSVLNIIASFAGEENQEDVVQKITKLRILSVEEKNIVQQHDKRNLMDGLQANAFESLMQVRDGDSKIDFLIRESKDKITNLLMLVDDKDSFLLLSLEGNVSWKDLQKLDLNLDIEGTENIKKIPRA